jgi:hypothetical protein
MVLGAVAVVVAPALAAAGLRRRGRQAVLAGSLRSGDQSDILCSLD